MTDNDKIANLTADAMRASGDTMIGDLRTLLQRVDQMAEDIRQLVEKFESEIGARTLEITDNIKTYVKFCGKTTDLIKDLQSSMSEPAVLLPAPASLETSSEIYDEFARLHALTPPLNGKIPT